MKRKKEEKYSLIEAGKMLLHNKYYIVILIIDVLRQTYSSIINMGIYFMTYVLEEKQNFWEHSPGQLIWH